MNKSIEIAALVLGGLSLFMVCFTGFAALSGKPLSQLPVVGSLFEVEPADPAASPSKTREPVESAASARRQTDHEVLESNLGLLGAWTLPSPYSQSELQALTDDLKGRSFRLDQREQEIRARELQIAEQMRLSEERLAALEDLRASLERYEKDLSRREQALAKSEASSRQREDKRWLEVARLFDSLSGEEASSFLAEYEPDEAAEILRQLDPDQAAEILAGLRSIPSVQDWRIYVDAYSEAASRAALE